ncbi:MAG: hypothetical protein EZS28_029820 [Streblomastix strix]|uniref:Uncharacterized protein n=1 Tax=Streblomastix strix TaxID=222440 RepID=A0A5J4UWH1_9EUKA|nr:MAG: hypothetical protein EZS28_029820 [Streblomastix strix]
MQSWNLLLNTRLSLWRTWMESLRVWLRILTKAAYRRIVVKHQTLDADIFDLGLRNGQDAVIYTSKNGYATEEIFSCRQETYLFLLANSNAQNINYVQQEKLNYCWMGLECISRTILYNCFARRTQPLDLTTFKAMKSKVKGIKIGFEPKSQGDKIQRAVQAIQMATAPFQNMAAFKRYVLLQNFGENTPVAKTDEARSEDKTAVLGGQ